MWVYILELTPPYLALDQPASAGIFVIDKDAAEFDGGRTLEKVAGFDEKRIMMLGRDIGPPIPGRDAHLLRDFVDAVDGPAFVAAGDDEGFLDAGERQFDGGDDEGFPFAVNGIGFDFASFDEGVDDGALADGADDDRSLGGRRGVAQFGFDAGDALHVGLQVASRANHAGPVGLIDVKGGRLFILQEGERGGAGVSETMSVERPRLGPATAGAVAARMARETTAS